jgi:hypothetical protein
MLANKPGWIRMSIHPTTTNAEIEYVCDAIIALSENHQVWAKDYNYDANTNEFLHKSSKQHLVEDMVNGWFTDMEPSQNNSFMKRFNLWKK